jgi:hypothetical protein
MEAKSTIWGTLPAPTRSSKRTRKEQKIKNHHRRNPKPQKKKKKISKIFIAEPKANMTTTKRQALT